MKRVAIVGGETHLNEITQLHGKSLAVVATCMDERLRAKALPGVDAPNFTDEDKMLREARPEIVALANANDLKHASVLRALRAGCDLAVDKPLCITLEEQSEIESYLAMHPERKVLNLLTGRGAPPWAALRERLRAGAIGRPAFVHVRMAVQLKRAERPPWFLDQRRSGGIFLDLLIHGLDQVEWQTGERIVAVTATTGNLGEPSDEHLRDHAAVFCELSNGGSALVEGQRTLPKTKGSDYRTLVAGSAGYADLIQHPPRVTVTNAEGAETPVASLPPRRSIVADWIEGGSLLPQEASLRANRLAILATVSAREHKRMEVT